MKRLLIPFLVFLPFACSEDSAPAPKPVSVPLGPYKPFDVARESIGKTVNLEAVIPAMCYTKTGGLSNPCYVCHVESRSPNGMQDWELQEEYAFSDFAMTNRWTNLFRDRTEDIAAISDDEAIRWVRADNYTALFEAMKTAPTDYVGWKPDLDFSQGFDSDGFAQDGSDWRAFRFKPFPGTFWPSAGSTDDVMIRLDPAFRQDAHGAPSREIYKVNLALLELAIVGDPSNLSSPEKLTLSTGALSEDAAGIDLDGDGNVGGLVTMLRGLPTHYVGGARDIEITRYKFPVGTAFLHTVRYLDPDAPNFMSRRKKEVRYMRKARGLDKWDTQNAYDHEMNEKEEGRLPIFTGTPMGGVNNAFGWRLTGFIEDEGGRLRLQTEEEHRFCMGCHSTVGVTVDSTFSFARKVPGADGWRHQDLRGIPDAPSHGSTEPEFLTYVKRVQGGDEFRANDEFLARFFPGQGLA